jgi:hypothetical protein
MYVEVALFAGVEEIGSGGMNSCSQVVHILLIFDFNEVRQN